MNFMPIIFYVWLFSLIAFIVLLTLQQRGWFKDESLPSIGAVVLLLVFLVTTAAGLWEAWSPWELAVRAQ